MKEEFKSEFAKDFAQRYQGVFGWFEKPDKTQLLVQLTRVGEDELTFVDIKGHKFSAYADQGNCFSFLPVERGVYNTPDGVLAIRRHPARQYKRGICPDNTMFQNLSSGAAVSVSFKTVDSVYSTDQAVAVEQFKKKLIGDVAFNKIFALANNQLYVYNLVIGSYDPKEKEFVLHAKIFKQEIEDLVTRLQLPILVSVK